MDEAKELRLALERERGKSGGNGQRVGNCPPRIREHPTAIPSSLLGLAAVINLHHHGSMIRAQISMDDELYRRAKAVPQRCFYVLRRPSSGDWIDRHPSSTRHPTAPRSPSSSNGHRAHGSRRCIHNRRLPR